jgi:hypothetical protein
VNIGNVSSPVTAYSPGLTPIQPAGPLGVSGTFGRP